MITYLNEKYDEEFVYAGYVEPGVMDEETLYARSLSDEKQRAVTVKINENGDFTDDYQGKSVVDYCEKLIDDYVESYFNSKEVAHFIELNNNDINSMNEIEDDKFNWNIGFSNIFIFPDAIYTEQDLEIISYDLAKFLYEHRIVSRNQFNILTNVEMNEIDDNNFTDYYDAKHLKYRMYLTISEDSVIITKSNHSNVQEYKTEEFFNNRTGV